ncbi:MAG: hypothetical protein VX438_07470, partial [Planctomycetota bacterium]|nr:hypothetical protein [Planctomycetota bacterium]
SDAPNETNGEKSPDGGGDTSEDPNNANSEDGMSNDQDNGNAKPENSDDATSSDNESDAGPSSNKSGNGDGETTNDDPASNEDSSNGNPTGESGENNATKNEPVRGSNSKSDDQHDGDIFEKLLDRLREEQSQKQQGTTPPSKQEPVEGNTDAANNQDATENSGNENENQPSSREGETQANAQTNSDDPQTGNPLNPKQPNNQKGVDPDAKGTSTKDPMKDPRDGNAGNEGEQVRDDGGSETTGKTGGSESGNSGVGETMNPNGENTTNTPGSEDGMGTSGSTESNIGLQANPQSRTGQKDASPTDELGLPEEVEDTEQARLEYTRKATDLALKYLRNHQDNPSDELLEDLGITAEQLREMVSRYEQLKQDNTQAGKETLYDTLKSLGLQPSTNTKGRRVKINPKDVNGVSGGGALSGLPPHLQQRFKSFRKGATVSDE